MSKPPTDYRAKEPVDTPITRTMKKFNSFWPSITFGIALLVGMGRMIAQQEQMLRQLNIIQTWIDSDNTRHQETKIEIATMLERLRVLEKNRP